MSGLLTRVATALTLAVIFFGFVWWPPLQPFFFVLIVVAATIGAVEYFSLLRNHGFEKTPVLAVAACAAITLCGAFAAEFLTPLSVLLAILMILELIMRSRARISTLLGTIFGILYIGWAAAHVNMLFYYPMHAGHSERWQGSAYGSDSVMMMIVVVGLTDIGAYFVGKSLGKHKLAPVLSPKKTWEGALGGLICACLGMATMWYLLKGGVWIQRAPWPLVLFLAAGAGVSIVAQIGDLTQSALKRDAGVKDSGNILPGHGGVLDRCDGFLFAAPVLYYFTQIVG